LRKVLLNIKLNTKKTVPLIFLLVFLAIAMLPTCKAQSSAPTVYIDPPTIVGEADEEFTATILAKDFTDLFTWGLGLTWNPAVLECTEFRFWVTLAHDVFDDLAPGRLQLGIPGTIDNVAGEITLTSQSLTDKTLGGVNGVPGVSYKLMEVDFKVKVSGFSDLHLKYVSLLNRESKHPSINIIDVFTAWEEDYAVKILTNSTGISGTDIFGHLLTPEEKQISFNMSSVSERDSTLATTGFCNVTIPNNLIWVDDESDWVVMVNDNPPLSIDIKQNATHYFIYFTYNHIGTMTNPGILTVEIIGKHVIPEFPTAVILPLLIALTLIPVILEKLLWSTKRRDRIIAK